MPLYEYFCKHCDGIFETIRQISQSSDPAPCPVCAKKAQRIPPTSFNARTIRDGYPRAIPDRGTYWHRGKEVKKRISGRVRPNEHPELTKPRPPKVFSKGERSAMADRAVAERKEQMRRAKDGLRPMIDRTKRRPRIG